MRRSPLRRLPLPSAGFPVCVLTASLPTSLLEVCPTCDAAMPLVRRGCPRALPMQSFSLSLFAVNRANRVLGNLTGPVQVACWGSEVPVFPREQAELLAVPSASLRANPVATLPLYRTSPRPALALGPADYPTGREGRRARSSRRPADLPQSTWPLGRFGALLVRSALSSCIPPPLLVPFYALLNVKN